MWLLETTNLSASYNKVRALSDVSIKVGEGKSVCIIGRNGSGKTTLVKTLMGLKQADGGDIFWKGEQIVNEGPHIRVKRGIALVPEGRRLFVEMKVQDNLLIGAYGRHKSINVRKELANVLDMFPVLKDRLREQASCLSGGEQQMVALGRALMSKPELLLLDEPSLGLAPIIIMEIERIIEMINSMGFAVLLVEQSAIMALRLSSYGYVFENSKVTCEGVSRDLANKDKTVEAYLGG